MTPPKYFPHARERFGLATIATAGLLSALSTSALLTYILWNTFLSRNKTTPLHRGIRSFTRSSLGCYLVSLLFCDCLQGAAFALNYRWAATGTMEEGSICIAQGAISEVGDLGAALWSIAIGIHTFSLLFFVKKPHPMTAPIVLLVGWSMIVILPILGPTVIQNTTRGKFYGLTKTGWCWIGPSYPVEQMVFLYVWVFTALGSSFVMYTLIYLRFSKFIIVDDNGKFFFTFRHRQSRQLSVSFPDSETHPSQNTTTEGVRRLVMGKSSHDATAPAKATTGIGQEKNGLSPVIDKHLKHVARRLMWYPVLYSVVVVPISVCRMGVLAGWDPPFGLLVIAGICFAGSGVSNVILFITTRHSFIKQVAKGWGGIHVTTERITMREDGAPEVLELENVKVDTSDSSQTTPKSSKYPALEEGGGYHVGMEEKVALWDPARK